MKAYACVKHVTLSLLRKGLTSLVFLPGKAEIYSAMDSIVKAGVETKCVVPFHAELDVLQLDAAKSAASHPRVIVSTSLAEPSITVPDVDVVIDLCVSRRRALSFLKFIGRFLHEFV